MENGTKWNPDLLSTDHLELSFFDTIVDFLGKENAAHLIYPDFVKAPDPVPSRKLNQRRWERETETAQGTGNSKDISWRGLSQAGGKLEGSALEPSLLRDLGTEINSILMKYLLTQSCEASAMQRRITMSIRKNWTCIGHVHGN